jgi:predicted transposase/invertase (TIGR01784 family)
LRVECREKSWSIPPEGDDYRELRPAIVICVLNVPLFPNLTQLHTDFRLRDNSGMILTDDLQIHLLELTKLQVTRENLGSASAVERWAYFLRFADALTSDEIVEILPEPEFAEAAGVLEMINKTPEQLHEYSARLKLRLDEAARLEYAREEAREQAREQALEDGLARGELIGRILDLEERIGEIDPTREELRKLELNELTQILERLRAEIRNRQQ